MVVAALAVMVVMLGLIVVVMMAAFPVMVVVMLMVMASAVAVLAMLVVVLVLMIMIVASAGASLAVVMVVMMLVGGAVTVDVHHDSGVLERVQRPVLQLVVVHIQHRGHEAELDGLAGPHLSVEEHSLVHIREVHGERLLPVADGHLDVTHKRARFPLDPSADLHEHVGEPGLDIGIESPDLTAESDGFAPGLLGGIELTHRRSPPVPCPCPRP